MVGVHCKCDLALLPNTFISRNHPTARQQRFAHQASRAVFVGPRTPAQASGTPAVQSNSMLHCYIRGLIVTSHQSPLTHHAEINRQPGRLETVVTRTKQTPATQINREVSGAVLSSDYDSQITPHAPSNRHTSRLENAVTHSKQTAATSSNRHFLHGLYLQVQQSQEFAFEGRHSSCVD